jgi:hypothetical protein
MGSPKKELEKELEYEKRLSAFRLEKWMTSEARMEAIWNAAIEAVIDRLGRHDPPCPDNKCNTCWRMRKLLDLKKLDQAGYIPLKERLWTRAKLLCEKDRSRPYRKGVKDMLAYVDRILGDIE